MRTIIIGATAAGMKCCESKRTNPDLHYVIRKRDYVSFGACGTLFCWRAL